MLLFADIFFTIIHLAIILFNLFGWIPRSTRRAHFVMVILTAASWFILGIWFGMGYCPITDWQWRVKELRGEINLPGNFVEYFAEKLSNHNFDSQLVNIVTGVSFALAALASVFVNFFGRKIKT
jgi:hypothetical protein